MTKRVSPFMLLGGGVAAVFVAALVGVMTWVAQDTPRASPFNARFSLVDDQGNPVDQSLFKARPPLSTSATPIARRFARQRSSKLLTG